MDRIVVWGIGNIGKWIIGKIKNCEIVAYVDVNPNILYYNGVQITRPDGISSIEYDYIIVTPMESESISRYIQEHGLDKTRIIFLYFLTHGEWNSWFFQFFRLVSYLDMEIIEKLPMFDPGFSSRFYDPRIFDGHSTAEEFYGCIRYAEKCGYLQLFNYPYVEKYITNYEMPIYDEEKKRYYVTVEGNRLYYPEGINRKEVILCQREYMMRNDPESPLMNISSDEVTGNVLVAGINELLYAIIHLKKAAHIDVLCVEEKWSMTIHDIADKDVRFNWIQTYNELINKEYDYVRINLENEEVDCDEVFNNLKARRIDVIAWKRDIVESIEQSMIKNKYMISRTGGYVYCPNPYDFIEKQYFRKGVITGII